MLDKVFIHELTAFASIGAYDWEHTIKQRLVFDIELYWDFSKAVETDDVQYCLNYAEVSQFVLDYVQSKPFLLVERVAYEVAEKLQTRFGIQWLRLKLSKPNAVPQAKSVGVVVEKGSLE